MKRLLMWSLLFSVVLYLANANVFAQGRGAGRGESHASTPGSQEHNSQSSHDKDADHSKSHSSAAEHGKDSDFESRIEHNAALKTKIEGMLPSGMNLKTAATGFRNEGQFIAAVHVSKNLNIPFSDLKAKMTGTNPMTLGKAIQALKPNMSEKDAEKEAAKAMNQAKAAEKTKPIS